MPGVVNNHRPLLGSDRVDYGNGLRWPTYDARRDPLMEFGEKGGVRTRFMKEKWDATLAGSATAN